ncbi:hypothetical protein NG827_15855 [Xanthomonas sacchari]|uniref:hypothetical protein n=1 Tax=Xanthomonas sacchari TaxID=56458 RepID=UPI00225696C3|nr:hypothetical protein [Xanthomonas sacchari]UYK83921.1 hypothetical protein NG827_15855 [Xanthomonas sacchari]
MKATDVFTPQRLPTVTLVSDHLGDMTDAYNSVMDEGGKLVRVVGPSKSGKTVFIKRAVGDDMVLVTGAGITATDHLWIRVLHGIGSDVGVEEGRADSRGGGFKVSGELEGNVIVAKGKVAGEVARDRASETSATRTKAVDLVQQVIKDLGGSGLTVFIDDFHYIPPDIQQELAQQIKQVVEHGVRIAAAAVPFRSEDALRANDDLQGRIKDFEFDYWDADELVEIAHKGFGELNIECSTEYAKALAAEAAGSPQLMQSLCLETCREMKVSETLEHRVAVPNGREFFAAVCQRVAGSVDFSTTIKVMRDGPLTRGSPRKAYVLKDGSAADVYQIIVRAIASDPPSLHFPYTDLQSRIANLCSGESPHVSDPCKHIAKLVNDRFQSDKIDWDVEQHLFSIRDPYLLFGVRWGD